MLHHWVLRCCLFEFCDMHVLCQFSIRFVKTDVPIFPKSKYGEPERRERVDGFLCLLAVQCG